MWLVPIVGFSGHKIPKSFHGYIPNRGTGTAWKEILSRVVKSKNIYELDFKGFFPSVDTGKLAYFLDTLGFPQDVNY